LPSAVAAMVVTGLYLIDALVIRPSRDVPFCAVAGLSRLAHWDAGWYLSIASSGYQRHPGIQQPSAFFPLLPIVASIGHILVPPLSITAAGVVINVVAILAAMVFVDRTVAEWPTWQRVGCVVALLVLPGAYFYVTFYSEALFALTVAMFVWSLRNDKLWLAAAAVAAASLDRTIGATLVLPLALVAFREADRRRAVAATAASLTGILGLGLYVVASGKLSLFRAGRAGWRGASGLSYPVYLLRHGISGTDHLIAHAALFRQVVDVPSIGRSVVWGLGLYTDVVVGGVLIVLFWARRTAAYLLIPAAVLGLATLITGPAISQERFTLVLLPLWIGVIALFRQSRAAWVATGLLGAASLAINLHLMGQFASCQWAG